MSQCQSASIKDADLSREVKKQIEMEVKGHPERTVGQVVDCVAKLTGIEKGQSERLVLKYLALKCQHARRRRHPFPRVVRRGRTNGENPPGGRAQESA